MEQPLPEPDAEREHDPSEPALSLKLTDPAVAEVTEADRETVDPATMEDAPRCTAVAVVEVVIVTPKVGAAGVRILPPWPTMLEFVYSGKI